MADPFDARIKRGFGMICVAPPFGGKTHFILQLLKNANRLIDRPFDYIYWFYGEHSTTIDELNSIGKVQTVAGLPENLDQYIHSENQQHGLFIFDDLMQNISNSEEIIQLVANKCQHKRISWIITLQNLFHHGKSRITILRCSHYLVLFRNPLDSSIGHHLARRILPSNPQTFIRIYEQCTQKPRGYLFVDGHQTTPDRARFRTDIFNDVQKVFIANSHRGRRRP